jgi:branched-chain amino acid transport system ATP-binding protein
VAEPVLQVKSLRKAFGGLRVTDDVTFEIRPGELHAVIGPNGAGKTTLINQIFGYLPPDAGRIIFDGHDVTAMAPHARAALGMARSFQINSILPGFSVLENVALAAQAHLGSSFHFIGRAANEAALNERAMAALAQVGMAGRAASFAGHLSHGEKRALELAIALVARPKLLLLDEPTAGTGPDESVRLVSLLLALKTEFAILLVEHDMRAVFALADRISVLIYGRLLASGPPSEVRANPQVIAAYLGDTME